MIQKLLQKFLILTRAKQIAFVVFALHFLTIFALSIHHLATYRSVPKRPIAVRTRPLIQPTQAPLIKPAAKPTPAPVAAKPIPAKKTPPPQQPTKPTVKKTAAAPKTVPSAPKTTTADSQSMLQEIAESLDSIASKEEIPQSKIVLPIPTSVQRKAEVSQTVSFDATYSEELISFLQNALDLPEHGEVKVQIEIDRFGTLKECSILESKSRKNAEFLKNRLPELAFPWFNDFSIADKTHKFTITFRNVEIR